MAIKRKPQTLQLHPIHDLDLISKIKGIPDGKRNSALKHALRVGFRMEPPKTEADNEIAQLQARVDHLTEMLEALPDYIRNVLEHIGADRTFDTRPVDMANGKEHGLSSAEIKERERNLVRQRW